jgi:hypothetical protein
MKQYSKVDSNGEYIGPFIVEGELIPADCVPFKPPNGLFRAKLNDSRTEFIEGATKEEIETTRNQSQPLSELELLKKQQTDLVFELMMKGVI